MFDCYSVTVVRVMLGAVNQTNGSVWNFFSVKSQHKREAYQHFKGLLSCNSAGNGNVVSELT